MVARVASFVLLGIWLLQASKKANVSFKSPSPKPHLNRTRSVFALSINGIVSCDSDCDSDTDEQPAKRLKHKPCEPKARSLSSTLLVGVRNRFWKCPNKGNFTLRFVWTKRCDSCAQGALRRRTVSQRNLYNAESLAKRYGETCH